MKGVALLAHDWHVDEAQFERPVLVFVPVQPDKILSLGETMHRERRLQCSTPAIAALRFERNLLRSNPPGFGMATSACVMDSTFDLLSSQMSFMGSALKLAAILN